MQAKTSIPADPSRPKIRSVRLIQMLPQAPAAQILPLSHIREHTGLYYIDEVFRTLMEG